MKRLLLIFSIFALLLTFTACANAGTKTENSDTKPSIESAKAEGETEGSETQGLPESSETQVETYTISAGGFDLKYPLKWKDKVTVFTSDDRASFSFGDTKLFDITFNSDEGVLFGTIKGDKNTVVRFVDYNATGENEEMSSMLEDVNVILQNLIKDYNLCVGDDTAVDNNDDTFDIETSLVTLKYPQKWKDKVNVDVTDLGVKFSNNGTPLFDILFSECNGFLIGAYKDTPIYIVTYEAQNEEQNLMQEDINVILNNLMSDSNFTAND